MPGDGKTAGRSISTPAPVRAAEACRHRRVQLEEMPRSAFDTEIGLTYTELTTDGVKAHLEVEPHLHQPMGIVHGGVSTAGLELVASAAINHGQDEPLRTASIRVNFLRPFFAGAESVYEGTALRIGRSTAVGDARAVGADGKTALVARITAYR